MGSTHDDEIARLVRAAAPGTADATDGDLDRAWNRIAGGLGGRPRRRRRLRSLAGGGLAVVVLGSAGVAAAGVWSAHTGEPVTDPEIRELSGPGEHIDPYAPDYPAVYDELTADIPYASDAARAFARKRDLELRDRDVADSLAAGHRVGMVSGGIRAQAARDAICSWGNEWAAATDAGDTARRNGAAAALSEARAWPAVTDIDAEQAYTPAKTLRDLAPGSGWQDRYRDETEFAELPLVVEAARGTHLVTMSRLMKDCWLELVPALPQDYPGGPWAGTAR